MCRSIKKLRGEEQVSEQELHEAALQYVRKISGYRVPSKMNQEVFDSAVVQVRRASKELLEGLAAVQAERSMAK